MNRKETALSDLLLTAVRIKQGTARYTMGTDAPEAAAWEAHYRILSAMFVYLENIPAGLSHRDFTDVLAFLAEYLLKDNDYRTNPIPPVIAKLDQLAAQQQRDVEL